MNVDIISLFKSQKKQITAFFLALLVEIACFFGGWILIILSPIVVFFVFKLLKVWKNKERVAYGLPAIIIGVAIFMLIFAYQMSDTPSQRFISPDKDLELTVKPYITSNYSSNFTFEVIYKGVTNFTMQYEIRDEINNRIIEIGNISGITKNNATHYTLTKDLGEGIYLLKFQVNKTEVEGEVIKATPGKLYQYFMYYSGIMIIALLSILYLLLLFGVHIIRRGKEIARLRYEKGA